MEPIEIKSITVWGLSDPDRVGFEINNTTNHLYPLEKAISLRNCLKKCSNENTSFNKLPLTFHGTNYVASFEIVTEMLFQIDFVIVKLKNNNEVRNEVEALKKKIKDLEEEAEANKKQTPAIPTTPYIPKPTKTDDWWKRLNDPNDDPYTPYKHYSKSNLESQLIFDNKKDNSLKYNINY